jgi:hypothetical protein
MSQRERLTAELDGEFVIFLIGLRINSLVRVHHWLPIVRAMPRMLRELASQPELGLLHAEAWFGRTTLMTQYWRSMDQLMDYAKSQNAAHLPAWREFNRHVGKTGSVGIWHETYAVSPGSYETIYVNMPAFGLGRAGTLRPATGDKESASKRMAARKLRP